LIIVGVLYHAIDHLVRLGKLVVAINLYLAIKLYLPFSLTKYSAIFAEVKGYFGTTNNQDFIVDNIVIVRRRRM